MEENIVISNASINGIESSGTRSVIYIVYYYDDQQNTRIWKHIIVYTESTIIQSTLLSAFNTNAIFDFELVDAQNCIIKRIYPFESKKYGDDYRFGRGSFSVSRIATQNTEGFEHLEVFIKDRNDYDSNPTKEVAKNIYEPLLQQILQFAFVKARKEYSYPKFIDFNIDLDFEDDLIKSVCIGDVLSLTYKERRNLKKKHQE